MPPSLTDLANYLDTLLNSSRFPTDQNGIYHPSSRPVHRLGLAIEPWPTINTWVADHHLDALFLHRPWHLDPRKLPSDLGILAYHLAFDTTLTFGFNPYLATVLHLTNPTPFAYKDSIPLGMAGPITSTSLPAFVEHLTTIFGAPPTIYNPSARPINHIAVVGAMTDATIREAAQLGVKLYITGQYRQPARPAVHDTAMTVAIIGHDLGERWGLHTLARLLQDRWPHLELILAS